MGPSCALFVHGRSTCLSWMDLLDSWKAASWDSCTRRRPPVGEWDIFTAAQPTLATHPAWYSASALCPCAAWLTSHKRLVEVAAAACTLSLAGPACASATVQLSHQVHQPAGSTAARGQLVQPCAWPVGAQRATRRCCLCAVRLSVWAPLRRCLRALPACGG
jgi:hypothetical protein